MMRDMQSDSKVRKALETLCRNYGWSYGFFWRFHQKNSVLLTMEDAYYEEHMGVIIDNMLLQVHMLGNGIVGQAAFTNKHRWMFSHSCSEAGSMSQDMFQDNFEIHHQFSSGIETISVIPVARGVVQFGSTQKIPESMEFVDETKRLFREIENRDMAILQDNRPSSSNSDIYGPNKVFPSLISPESSYPGNLNKSYVRTACSLTDLPQLSPFTSDYGMMSSSHLCNQLQMAGTGNPFKLSCKSNTWLQHPHSQSVPYCNHSSSTAPCISSFTTTLNYSDGNNNFLNDSSFKNDPFDSLEVNFDWGHADEFLNDILLPVASGDQLDVSIDTSECISEQPGTSTIAPQESLFSKLGLEQFMYDIAGSSNSIVGSSFGDKSSSSSKRMCSYNIEEKKEVIQKSCSRIGDSYSTTDGSSLLLQPKKSKESMKFGRKRGRPGSRQKSKHLVQFREHIAELRELLPDGEKMSIDSLLAQTIKHMIFLLSVTNHAEKLEQAVVQKERDVGPQSMVGLVDVKDISTPDQKLIQIHCEETGLFLELVDIIRGCGWAILKGVMEVREDKIWACFIVEDKTDRQMMKWRIYQSLKSPRATSEINVTDQLAKIFNGGTALFNNYHQPSCATSHRLV
ncbi:Transcription factor LHW like [Actinidia chinensis var. chinensis]|uniref:Transcription factor LHW like n=1 Tax=Actinidia chinensis var. chinensis TaxID=1590841 RepID=A0A2R6QMU3_ACTCC|nr:Transcription factor LHW like [Actinidia chinensis var. chinensis]